MYVHFYIMNAPLSLRFFHLFFRGFFRTVTEKIVDSAVLFFALIYWFKKGSFKQHFWESVLPWVGAICVIIIWHAWMSAVVLIREIREEQERSAVQRKSPVLLASGEHAMFDVISKPIPYYRPKIYGLATMLCGVAMFALYLTWELSSSVSLVSAPPISLNAIPPSKPEIVLHDPVLHIEPENKIVWSTRSDVGRIKGLYTIILHNSGLEDADVMELSQKYFLAQRGTGIIVKSIGNVVRNQPMRLKRKSKLPIHLDFNPYLDTFKEVAANFTEGPSRAGVFILAKVRRHADGKDYTFSRPYGLFNFDGVAIFTEGTSMDSVPVQLRPQFLTLHEVAPYLDSPEHWTSVTKEVTFDANGKPHIRLY